MDLYDFSVAVYRILTRNGIDSMEQLLALRRFQIRTLKGMTPRVFEEIDSKIKHYYPRREYKPKPKPAPIQVEGQMSIFDFMEVER